jgi:phage shock protein C
MYCTRCGSELRDTDRFCSQCGVNVAAPQTSPAPYPSRPLARIMYDKKIAGICAGFARYFDCDVTLMRVIWLVLAFGTGVGFIAYIVAWIVMPKEYRPPSTVPVNVGDRSVCT